MLRLLELEEEIKNKLLHVMIESNKNMKKFQSSIQFNCRKLEYQPYHIISCHENS